MKRNLNNWCTKTVLVGVFLLSFAFMTQAHGGDTNSGAGLTKEQKQKLDALEVYEKGQSFKKKYSLISPISEKARNEQEVFTKLKRAAVKLNADAIIDLGCEPTSQQEPVFGLTRSIAYCHGKAVRWE